MSNPSEPAASLLGRDIMIFLVVGAATLLFVLAVCVSQVGLTCQHRRAKRFRPATLMPTAVPEQPLHTNKLDSSSASSDFCTVDIDNNAESDADYD